MLGDLLKKNIPHVVWSAAFLLALLICFKIYKFIRIANLDKNYREMDASGNLLKQGHNRSIWDYSFFPGLSRLWHQSEWQSAIAILILLIMLIAYLWTKDEALLSVLGINFGVVVGMMIRTKS